MGRIGLSTRWQRSLSRLLQISIAVILLIGLVSRNLSIVINASIALAATFVPAFLARDHKISLDTGIVLWISIALFLHTLGMLGLYNDVWWYDHVTHTLSATIVAAIGYVAACAVAEHDDALYLPSKFLFAYILLFTLALGVVWEVLEFGARIVAERLGFEPVLVQYGFDDSLLDLVFNTIGALLVALFGTHRVSGIVELVTSRLSEKRDFVEHSVSEWPSRPSMEAGLETLLNSASTNTRLAWIIIAFLFVAVPSSALSGDFLQTAFIIALLVLVLLPAIAARDPYEMLPWQLLLMATLPLAGDTLSLPGLVSTMATYVAVAAVALVVAVELHLFTTVQMTPRFAVFFVVITTMATAGVWAVSRWITDLYLGTQFLLVPGVPKETIEAHLMWEFVYSTLTGIGAGILYERAFRPRRHEVDHGSTPEL